MTKRKDKKAPIKISATEKVTENADNQAQIDQTVELSEAQVNQEADKVVEIAAEQEQTVDVAEEAQVAEQPAKEEVKAASNAKTDKTAKTENKAENKSKTDKNGKKTARKEKKDKKGLKRRTKETVSELKKVTWPTFPEVVKRTGIVLAFVVIFAIVIFAFDLLLGFASSALMGRPFNPFG